MFAPNNTFIREKTFSFVVTWNNQISSKPINTDTWSFIRFEVVKPNKPIKWNEDAFKLAKKLGAGRISLPRPLIFFVTPQLLDINFLHNHH